MSQITNYREKIKKKNLGPNLGLFKIGLIWSIWLYFKQQKLLNQNLFLKYFSIKAVQNRPLCTRQMRQFNICITTVTVL